MVSMITNLFNIFYGKTTVSPFTKLIDLIIVVQL